MDVNRVLNERCAQHGMLRCKIYSPGNKRIRFFVEKKYWDTLAAVNIGYDKCPIFETC